MVTALLTSLHVLVATVLIFMVLLQKGKGADIGAAFGGASQTIFGPRGAQSFLAKITTGAAVIFMVTSLTLAISAVQEKLGHGGCAANRTIAARCSSARSGTCAGTGLQIVRHPESREQEASIIRTYSG